MAAPAQHAVGAVPPQLELICRARGREHLTSGPLSEAIITRQEVLHGRNSRGLRIRTTFLAGVREGERTSLESGADSQTSTISAWQYFFSDYHIALFLARRLESPLQKCELPKIYTLDILRARGRKRGRSRSMGGATLIELISFRTPAALRARASDRPNECARPRPRPFCCSAEDRLHALQAADSPPLQSPSFRPRPYGP